MSRYSKSDKDIYMEVLKPSMGAGAYIKDFRKSDAPQFKGKTEKEKDKMAVAAYLDAKDELDEALPPHLAKLFDKDGNFKDKKKQAKFDKMQKAARKGIKFTSKDVTPKGYGPEEGIEEAKTPSMQALFALIADTKNAQEGIAKIMKALKVDEKKATAIMDKLIAFALKKEEVEVTEREDTAAAVARALKKMGVKYDRKKEDDIISKIPKVLDSMNLSSGAKRMMLRDRDFIADVLGDLGEEVDIQEDGHTDVASAIRQCKTIVEDAMQITSKLQTMNPEDSLPSWWTNKLAVSSNSMNKLRDYFLVPTTEELDEGFSPKDIKMAIGIASDPRYAKGNMTGAVNAIEKIKKGLSKHKQVAAVLKRQNENVEEQMNESIELDERAPKMKYALVGKDMKIYSMGSDERDLKMDRRSLEQRFKDAAPLKIARLKTAQTIGDKVDKSQLKEETIEEGAMLNLATVKFQAKDALGKIRHKVTKKGNKYIISVDSNDEEDAQKAMKDHPLYAAGKLRVMPESFYKKITGVDSLSENRAKRDAMRAMGRRRGKDPADIDTDASDDDVKAASKNIIMQLRKSVSLKGNFDVEFEKEKKKVPANIAQAALDRHARLRTSMDKGEFDKKIRKSYRDLLNALKEK